MKKEEKEKDKIVAAIGGHQYLLSPGDEVLVDRLPEEKGKEVVFDQILLLSRSGRVKIGNPLIKGMKIRAKILKHLKGKKLRIARFKAKSRYRKVKGFRPSLSKIKIEKIEGGKEKNV